MYLTVLQEETFVGNDSPEHHKKLPRLPSADDAYDDFDESSFSPDTPKATMASLTSFFPISPTPLNIFRNSNTSSDLPVTDHEHRASQSSGSSSSTSDSSQRASLMSDNPIHLLSSLRHTFQRTEQSLYSELSGTPSTSLNNVRRAFQTAARGAARRLFAWETKHLPRPSKGSPIINVPSMQEPEWWKIGCHAVPGGNVIVREDDWGSIIAFTLRSTLITNWRGFLY